MDNFNALLKQYNERLNQITNGNPERYEGERATIERLLTNARSIVRKALATEPPAHRMINGQLMTLRNNS